MDTVHVIELLNDDGVWRPAIWNHESQEAAEQIARLCYPSNVMLRKVRIVQYKRIEPDDGAVLTP